MAAEQTRRTRQREREESREKLTKAVHRLLRGKGDSPDLEPVIDRIQSWMKHRTGDEVGGILELSAGVRNLFPVCTEVK